MNSSLLAGAAALVIAGFATPARDGECETVAGRHIDIMADARMHGGDEMVLQFKRARA